MKDAQEPPLEDSSPAGSGIEILREERWMNYFALPESTRQQRNIGSFSNS